MIFLLSTPVVVIANKFFIMRPAIIVLIQLAQKTGLNFSHCSQSILWNQIKSGTYHISRITYIWQHLCDIPDTASDYLIHWFLRYPFNIINTYPISSPIPPPTPKTPPSFTPYLEHCPTWPTGKTRYAPPAATCLKKQLITSRRNPVQKPLLPKISIYQESGTFTINCELGTIKNQPVFAIRFKLETELGTSRCTPV